MKNIDIELRELKKRYTSPATMAEALRNHPGFEKLDRTTISRWFNKPISPRQVRRVALAIEILKSKREAGILVIAEPRTLWVLPSTMLTSWPPQSESGKPYGLLASKYHIRAERQETTTGGQALELLDDGKVAIALAARQMVNHFTSVTRLCSIAKTYIAGIATRTIDSTRDLKTLRFGHPSLSAIPDLIKHAIPAHGELRSFASAKDAAAALLDNHVDAFVAWEPLISEIAKHIITVAGDSRKLYPIESSHLGTIDIDVFINVRNANPSVVRRYLLALAEAVRYIEEHKSRDVFHADIARRLGIEQRHVKSSLAISEFTLENLELAAVITLWEREVYDN